MRTLFKYANTLDTLCILFGIATSVASGIALAIEIMSYGNLIDAFVKYSVSQSICKEHVQPAVRKYFLKCLALGIGTVIASYIGNFVLYKSTLRQMAKIRSVCFKSILNKDMIWFDMNRTIEWHSMISEDLQHVEEALGEKLLSCTYDLAVFTSGCVTAFLFSWRLALMCLIHFPVTIFAIGFMMWISHRVLKEESSDLAADIAEEAIKNIRTVRAYNGENTEKMRYERALKLQRSHSVKRILFVAIRNSLQWFSLFLSYALSFSYGVQLISDSRDAGHSKYTSGTILTVFVSILFASWSFAQCLPTLQVINKGKTAAERVFQLIDEPPKINLARNQGHTSEQLDGDIYFRNVYFYYTTRANINVLENFNLHIRSGQTVAIVGGSKCGKSTLMALLLRFYDPTNGQIRIDGKEIRYYDLTWLRKQIHLVSEEPVLFAATIAENIRYGKFDATLEEIKLAAKRADADGFIKSLPDGYNTVVTDQLDITLMEKQQIAVARALIGDPAILLIDAPAISSSIMRKDFNDMQSTTRKKRTTIVVDNKLSNIMTADMIVVMQNGAIVESGDHFKLMESRGVYYNLMTAQLLEEEQLFPHKIRTDYSMIIESKPSPTHSDTDVIESSSLILRKILRINRPEWGLIIIGALGSVIHGSTIPIYAFVFAKIAEVVGKPDTAQLRSEGKVISMYFLLIGVVSGFSSFIQNFALIKSGEELTTRVQSMVFGALLRQEISWYEKQEKAICSVLSTDAMHIQAATGLPIGIMLNAVSGLLTAIILSFTESWKLSLVGICFVPLIFVVIYLEAVLSIREGWHSINALKTTNYVFETMNKITVVAAYNIEDIVHKEYDKILQPYFRYQRKTIHLQGVISSLGRSAIYFCYAAITYHGGYLVCSENMKFNNIIKSSEALVTGAWTIAGAVTFILYLQRCIRSARLLFSLLSRVPKIRDGSYRSDDLLEYKDITFTNVSFSYPTGHKRRVLCNFTLTVDNGQTLAFVGPNGCGKSTIWQLLLRFYDPQSGDVYLGNDNIKSLQTSYLLANMAIVFEAPCLFHRTIKENIAYGCNFRSVSDTEIIEAARLADCQLFIQSLPNGYDTIVGNKGVFLSCDQIQRILLARALLRNPAILILDEITSILDIENENRISAIIDKARIGRTCIITANRLSTIKDADVICMLANGSIDEIGTHEELMANRGGYFQIYTLQSGHYYMEKQDSFKN